MRRYIYFVIVEEHGDKYYPFVAKASASYNLNVDLTKFLIVQYVGTYKEACATCELWAQNWQKENKLYQGWDFFRLPLGWQAC